MTRHNEDRDKYILNLKKEDNTSEKELNEMEIRNLLVKEFKAVIIKMHTKLGRLMERHNVNFNKELEITKRTN